MKKLQKLLAMMLTVVMCVGTLADTGFTVFAAEPDEEVGTEADDAAPEAEPDEEAGTVADDVVPGDEVTDETVSAPDAEPAVISEEDGDEDAEEEADDEAALSIWVGGVQVTTDNCDNIPDAVTGTGAKVSFDVDKNVLKFENVTGFKGSHVIKGHSTDKAYIYSERSITISGDISHSVSETYGGWAYVLFVQGTNNTLTLDTTKFFVDHPGVTPIGTDGDFKTGDNFKSASVYARIDHGTAVEIGGSATFTKGEFNAQGRKCGIKVGGDLTVNGGTLNAITKNDSNNGGTAISCDGDLIVKSGKFDAFYDASTSASEWYAAKVKGDLDIDWNNMYVSSPYGATFKDQTFWDEFRIARGESTTKARRVIIEKDSSAKYSVWVGGIRLTENKSQKGVPGLTGGIANYDNSTKTFMLNGVSGFVGNKEGYGIYAEQDITVSGTADLSSSESGFGFIYTKKNLNVAKPDYDSYKAWLELVTLYESNVKTDIKARVPSTALKAGTDITIKDSAIDVTSTGSGITAISAGGNISVESNSLKAKADNGVAIQGNNVDGGLKINPEYLKIVKPEGGSISKGTVLNSNGQKATYVETAVVTPYNVWVGNTRVTGENYSDVLGNGKVSYDHSTKTLTLNGLKDSDISAAYEVNSTSKAYIYAEQMLTIKGSAELTGETYSIFQKKGTLIVDADLKLNPTASSLYVQEGALTINGGKIECSTTSGTIFTLTGDITINGGDISASTTSDSTLVAAVTSWGGKLIINGGKLKAESGNVALLAGGKITMADTVEIYEPDGGKISDSGTQIVDKEGKAAKSVLIDKVLPKYQVGFNSNGHGTAPAMQNVREGFKVKNPGTLTAAGFTFNGWYKEEECKNLYDFDTPVTGPLTLYAGWLDNSKTYYKVKFDLNGHGNAIDLPAEQTIEEGQTASEPAQKPFEAGFIFKGWATEKTGTTPYVFSTPVNSNLTLYAIWQPETPVYSVKFEMNGHGGMAPATQYIEEGKTAAVPEEPTDAEYTFVGWFVDENCITAYDFATPVTANVTLYAGWVLKVSALNPVPVIKAGDTSITLVKGQKFTLPGAPEVKWETANKKFVAINKKGVLTAKKVTEAPVEIKDGTRTVKVTVVQPKFAKKAIKATVTDYTPVSLGFDAGSAEIPVAYYSNSPSVVQVVGDQYIALGKGSATVTAYVNGKAYTCRISVKEKTPAVERLLLMNVNDKKQLNVPGVKIVEWSCDPDPDPVIELSGKKNDKVKGLKPGHAEVTGKDKDGNIYKIYVTVEDMTITSIGAAKAKNKYSITLKAGETRKIEFAGLSQYVIFKSSKGEVAFADEYGIIRAQKAGKSKLTAKINKKSVTINVIVE